MPIPAPAGGLLFFAQQATLDVANAENAGAIFCQKKETKA